MSRQHRHPVLLHAQRGAALLVAMIFMIVLMLIVASAVKLTNTNTKVVGNMQVQQESEAAAQKAIEDTISTDFTTLATPPTINVDINNSGQAGSTYVVQMQPSPACVSVKPIKLSDLDASNAADVPCYASGAAQNSGIVGAAGSGDSLCSNSNWEITAATQSPGVTTTNTTTVQGVAVRVPVGSSC